MARDSLNRELGRVLIMTCSLGGLIRIGDEIQLSFRTRDKDRVAVSVFASATSELVFDGAVLNPYPVPVRRASYCFSLRKVRRFRIDDVDVMVWLPGDAIPLAAECLDCVHVGISVSRALCVSYEYEGRSPSAPLAYARHFWN